MATMNGPAERPGYLSFLVRLWRAGGDEKGSRPEEEVWRASLESVQTGTTASFAHLEDLVAYLREQTGSAPKSEES